MLNQTNQQQKSTNPMTLKEAIFHSVFDKEYAIQRERSIKRGDDGLDEITCANYAAESACQAVVQLTGSMDGIDLNFSEVATRDWNAKCHHFSDRLERVATNQPAPAEARAHTLAFFVAWDVQSTARPIKRAPRLVSVRFLAELEPGRQEFHRTNVLALQLRCSGAILRAGPRYRRCSRFGLAGQRCGKTNRRCDWSSSPGRKVGSGDLLAYPRKRSQRRFSTLYAERVRS